jgi:Fic family protein
LERPVFYLSEYFEAHREEYIDCLNALHQDPTAWEPWLLFFLRAVDEQARENMRRAAAMQRLYKELQTEFPNVTNSASCGLLLDAIFESPIFSKPIISARIHEVNTATIHRMINSLLDAGILHMRTNGAGRRAATYQLRELSLIAQGLPIKRFDY